MTYIKCPKCKFQFNAEQNFKDRVYDIASFFQIISRKHAEPIFKRRNDIDEISESILTICPNCKNEFPFADYKFFGIIGTKSIKAILILFILGFILFSVGTIISAIMK